jgi:hypothetical protein
MSICSLTGRHVGFSADFSGAEVEYVPLYRVKKIK